MPKQTKRKGSTLDRSAASTSAAATSASASASASASSLKEWLKKPTATAKAPSPSASFDAWLPKKPSSPASPKSPKSPKSSSATSRPSKKPKQGSPQRAPATAPAPTSALPMESMTSSQFAQSIGRMPPAVQRQILERVDCVTLRRLYNTTSPDAAPAFREFLRTAVEALCPPVAPAAPRKPRRGPSSP